MPNFPTPINEAARIEALHGDAIYTATPSDRLQEIVCTLKQQLDVPIAAIALVDSATAKFKAAIGLSHPETRRERAICGYAILQDAPLVIEDTAQDSRTCDNPLFTSDPRLRFYAGAPLILPSGHRIGALCCLDLRPRRISDRQRVMLAALARRVLGIYDVMDLSSSVEPTRRPVTERIAVPAH